MYRKGTFNNINEPLSRPETSGRICKTPRLVLNKLNIPLDSVVIVKGDSIIFPVESTKNLPSETPNIIDITASDDDLSNDVDFQNMVIKRFQSTKERSSDETKESHNPSQSLEIVDIDEALHQTSSSVEPPSVKKYYSYGPKSRRKLLPHPKTIRKKIKGMSTVTERKSPMKLFQPGSDKCFSAGNIAECTFSELHTNSKSDGDTEDNTVNVEDQPNESSIVSKSTSYVLSNKAIKSKISSVNSKSGHNSSKINLADDVAEIIAMLEDSPVERDENEMHDNISENKKDTNAIQSEFTPSRISQRIKNKKVKFSALRLLAGGELPSSKKKAQTNSVKKTSTPKKSAGKTDANSTADINANNSDLSPIAGVESFNENKIMKEKISNFVQNEDSIDKPKLNKSASHKPLKLYTNVKKMLASKNKLIGNSEKMPPPHEKVSVSSPSKEKETHDLNSTNLKKNNVNESRTNGSEEMVQKSSLVRENYIEIKDVSNKIRVELQGAPQKKIVNITISHPSSIRREDSQVDSIKEKKDIALGPDIIIRKIKSGKKQDNDKTVAPINEKEKTVARNENIQNSNPENSVNLVSDVFQNNLIIKNLIYPEKTTKSGIKPMREVEVPPQIKKFIEETTKNKKPGENVGDNQSKSNVTHKSKKKSELNKKKYETKSKQKVRRMQSSDEEYSDRELDLNDTTEPDNSDVQIINSTFEDDDRITDGDGSTEKITKKSTVKPGDTKKPSKEEIFNSNVMRVGGKKTAKVQPLRQVTKVTLKSDLVKKASDKFKPINEKDKDYTISKSKSIPRLHSPTELSVLGGKRNYKNAFEKYFICKEKIYNHNDSMDSDSSSDDEDNLFSHFIDLRRRNRSSGEVMDETGIPEHSEDIVNQSENNGDQINNPNADDNSIISELGEVIKGIITSDLPKWTCHAIPENSVICLLLLERETNGTYDVRKSIELDDNFNANVYVNKKLIIEYCGVYDSYEAIKNLIYQVELL